MARARLASLSKAEIQPFGARSAAWTAPETRNRTTIRARTDEFCQDASVTSKTTDGRKQVEAYLAGFASEQRETLAVVRDRLRAILPLAIESLKYGMPTFSVNGKGVAGYAGFKAHCSYFPHSSAVLTAAGSAVAASPTSKGGLRFSIGKPLSVALLRRLVKLRLAEIAAS